ncbi:thioredoxin-disulfide reductase, partial [Thermodesulfobacteriota bacterium]
TMENLIIIGSGPAGLTAAIYTARAQHEPLVIDGLAPGGQLMTTTVIENWPGTPKGVDGQQLMADMREQAQRFGTRFQNGAVSAAELSAAPFRITVGSDTIEARSVIIATGASPRMLGLDAEQALMGRGVSACATCDGFFFRGKKVFVIGGGDTALEEAIFLSSLASTVTVVHRRDELRAEKIMQQRAFDTPNISFLWDSVVEDIKDRDQGTVTGAVIKNVKTGETTTHECDGIFMALGHIPNTQPFAGQITLDDSGFIVTSGGSQTNIPGVFAAGDVADPTYKQAVTAAGMGCMAALDVERYLKGI